MKNGLSFLILRLEGTKIEDYSSIVFMLILSKFN